MAIEKPKSGEHESCGIFLPWKQKEVIWVKAFKRWLKVRLHYQIENGVSFEEAVKELCEIALIGLK